MEVDIDRNSEYRIEVAPGKKLRVMVLRGLAEVLGQELLNDKWHVFSDIKIAIFTFTGAKLRLDGTAELQYPVLRPFMPQVFAYFDGLRPSYSRTVIVVGSGRTTFCTALINFLVRLHHRAIFTEIDPSRGNIFPGTLSTMAVDGLVDYNEGFHLNNPSCLFYGSTDLDNMELYDLQVHALVKIIERMAAPDGQAARGESVHLIVAPEFGSDKLNELVKEFGADEVVVVGNERLFHQLSLIVGKVFIENTGYTQQGTGGIAKSIGRYFNGVGGMYSPCSITLKNKHEIVRIGEEHAAPESALPLGAARKVGRTGINRTELVSNCVLAISEAQKEEEVATSIAAGFVVVTDPSKMKMLCTQTALPRCTYLVQGSIQYLEY